MPLRVAAEGPGNEFCAPIPPLSGDPSKHAKRWHFVRECVVNCSGCYGPGGLGRPWCVPQGDSCGLCKAGKLLRGWPAYACLAPGENGKRTASVRPLRFWFAKPSTFPEPVLRCQTIANHFMVLPHTTSRRLESHAAHYARLASWTGLHSLQGRQFTDRLLGCHSNDKLLWKFLNTYTQFLRWFCCSLRTDILRGAALCCHNPTSK